MSLISALAIAILLFILTISSYIARLYAETGKFLSGEFQENIDVWELKVEPRLGLSRERIALSAAVLSPIHAWLRWLSSSVCCSLPGTGVFVPAWPRWRRRCWAPSWSSCSSINSCPLSFSPAPLDFGWFA